MNCLNCETELVRKTQLKFCFHSCAVTITNKLRGTKINCENCGVMTLNSHYCSKKCFGEVRIREGLEQVLKTRVFPAQPETTRKYLTILNGWKCSICFNTEWMGQRIPLVMDHIDGNSSNWSIDNIRFVCGNCDAQLSTYKGRNKGNGRFARAERYRQGLSH